ncbi:MAG: aromatic amino acid lyase, partial [Chloroflexota bacterium]
FHGEPVGLAMDYLKIALAEIGAISERRIFHLTDEKMNAGLPPMLVDDHESAGLNSGLMMPQYTAASLVLENQALANPNSIHSLPTSGGKEDHNANAMTAARNAFQLAHNVSHILAIELFTASQALDIRIHEIPNSHMGVGVLKAHAKIRDFVAYHASDTWWGPQIEAVKQIVEDGKLTNIIGNLVDAA